MSEIDLYSLILEYKKIYQKIGVVTCPYFQGEPIIFNRKGFDHLLRKGRSWRPVLEQKRRMALLGHAEHILKGNHLSVQHRISKKGDILVSFWGFEAYVGGVGMRLVVRQSGSGPKHFFGIFPIQH